MDSKNGHWENEVEEELFPGRVTDMPSLSTLLPFGSTGAMPLQLCPFFFSSVLQPELALRPKSCLDCLWAHRSVHGLPPHPWPWSRRQRCFQPLRPPGLLSFLQPLLCLSQSPGRPVGDFGFLLPSAACKTSWFSGAQLSATLGQGCSWWGSGQGAARQADLAPPQEAWPSLAHLCR